MVISLVITDGFKRRNDDEKIGCSFRWFIFFYSLLPFMNSSTGSTWLLFLMLSIQIYRLCIEYRDTNFQCNNYTCLWHWLFIYFKHIIDQSQAFISKISNYYSVVDHNFTRTLFSISINFDKRMLYFESN